MNNLKDGERLDDLQFKNLFIIQDPNGYCFTSDAVALANFVKCKPNGKVVDLCSGSGVIGILVNAKNIVSKVYLVEIQKRLADMSARSIEYNNLQKSFEVLNRPLQGVSEYFKNINIDCVVCNPPYKKEKTSKLLGESEEISIARHEIKVTLEEIILESSKILKFGGKFYLVNKEERLTEIIILCAKYGIEVKRIKVLKSAKGANIVLIEGVKGGKSGCKIEF